jgi:hypothetical protein
MVLFLKGGRLIHALAVIDEAPAGKASLRHTQSAGLHS